VYPTYGLAAARSNVNELEEFVFETRIVSFPERWRAAERVRSASMAFNGLQPEDSSS
jgi:hypothetical protein